MLSRYSEANPVAFVKANAQRIKSILSDNIQFSRRKHIQLNRIEPLLFDFPDKQMDVVYTRTKWLFQFYDNDALANMKYFAENEYQMPVKSDAKL